MAQNHIAVRASAARHSKNIRSAWRGGFFPLTARGQDMGNKVGIDMGNSFQFICGPFRGHVIEGPYSIHPTPAIREVGLEGPTKHGAIVSVVSHQPQMRLQMEASIRTTWSARTAGSAAPSGALAPANEPRMVEADSADEAGASQLGNSQTASSIAQGIQRARGSGSAHDWPLAPKDETQRPSSSTDSARTTDEPWEVDWSWPKQPRMDGGFQRVVSNTRWAAGRTVDSAGPVQPLPAEYPIVARSTVGAGAKNLFAIVWTLRLPGGHPRGQRRTVWIDWPSGSFAIERLVDSIGDFGGIHRARPSRTECWARTNASSVEGRADSAALEQPAGAATTDRSVGRGVQPASASRSAGAENSLRALPSTSSGPEEEQHEISAGMVGAEGAEQRADQVARTKAICGGSLRWVSRGFEAGQKEMGDVFWAIADWRTLGNRCGCNATSQVCSRPKTRSTFRPQIGREAGASTNDVRERTSSHALRAVPLRGECYRTHRYAAPPAGRSAAGGRGRRKCYPCPGLKCYPCPGPPPTRALSLGRG